MTPTVCAAATQSRDDTGYKPLQLLGQITTLGHQQDGPVGQGPSDHRIDAHVGSGQIHRGGDSGKRTAGDGYSSFDSVLAGDPDGRLLGGVVTGTDTS